MKKILILSLILTASQLSKAQNKEKIAYEVVKSQCASMPLEKRARVAVTRFNVTTSSVNDDRNQNAANANNTLKALSMLTGGGGNAPKADAIPVTLGDNLSAMLTNALQGINCFRVLETLKNNGDLTTEIDAGDSKYSSKKAPKAGKQLGPQIVATGEITEYSVKGKGLNVMGVGARKKLVKIGFNLKLINPETRDIICSRLIRVQSKSSGSVDVMGFVSTENSDPAIAAVMEDGVIQAVQYMAHVRDSLNITVDNIPGSTHISATNEKEIEIVLSNANYTNYNFLSGIISGLPGYKSMDKSLSSGTGDYTVTIAGSIDLFLNSLTKKAGTRYEVTGVTPDKIEMTVK